jgi:GNAT superfamily N-acetyltransferase
MTEMLTIRMARSGDHPAIAELCVQLGYTCTGEQARPRLEHLLARPDHAVFVAELAGRGVIGWVHVYLSPLLERELQSEIGGLVTDEAHRRLGAGRLLMQRAEEWTKRNGGRAVCLRSNVVREDAHEFYRRLGYTSVKTSYTFRKPVDTGPPAA